MKTAEPPAGAGSETLAPGRVDSGADASTSAPSVPVARATLLLVPLLWATYNPALRFIYESPTAPTPAELSAVRMLISLVPFSFVLAGVARDESRGRRAAEPAADASGRNLGLLTRAGMELGALNAAGTAFQAYGLELTSSTRAGFLLSTINVLVPPARRRPGNASRARRAAVAPRCGRRHRGGGRGKPNPTPTHGERSRGTRVASRPRRCTPRSPSVSARTRRGWMPLSSARRRRRR